MADHWRVRTQKLEESRGIGRRVPKGSPNASVDRESVYRALFAAQGSQIDSELFRFLIQVAVLKAKFFCCEAHIVMRPLQFRQDDFAFKDLYSVSKRT